MILSDAYRKYRQDGILPLIISGKNLVKRRFFDPHFGRWGKYKYSILSRSVLKPKICDVKPKGQNIKFKIFLPYGRDTNDFDNLSYTATRYHKGEHESEVLSTVLEQVNKDTILWEVGARFGYFSLAVADEVEQVFAIEPVEKNIEYIHKSIAANGYNNIDTIQSYINNDTTLDDIESNHSTPDVIVMDIEGWELMALQNSKNLLTLGPTWIIEVHRSPRSGFEPPEFSKNTECQVRKVLKENGYNLNMIGNNNGNGNYHIIAETRSG